MEAYRYVIQTEYVNLILSKYNDNDTYNIMTGNICKKK